MRKAEIIKEVSGKTGIERTMVEAIVEALTTSVQEHLLKKETVFLKGFGRFIIKKRAAKIARNITKNTAMKLPAYNIPAFKPAKQFRAKVIKTVK
jgi:DNA-binding protein HU-beta